MLPAHRCERVAIIGCGYVGMATGRRLVVEGTDVLGTTTTPERFGELSQVGIQPSLARVDQEILRDICATVDTVVITVAAGRHNNYSDVYATGAKNIIAAITGTSVQRIIYTSSTRVYSENNGAWVDENTPTVSIDDASAALIDAERTLLDGGAKLDISTSILRLGGLHGPGRELAPRICAAAGTTRSDGDMFVNLVDVRDIVSVIVALTRISHHGVLNVTDGAPITRRRLYDRELDARELPPITWLASPEKKLGKRVRNDRVSELLGLSFRVFGNPDDPIC
jgi:nucleoside-diphosphate-sugar epimerase